MPKIKESQTSDTRESVKLPISVIIPVRNEANNLQRCLDALQDMGEVYVVDSQSTDATVEIARAWGAQVVQFFYKGGWPKKRQWAMETLPLTYEWILLLDADEVLPPELAQEIGQAVRKSQVDGYYIALQMHFLGRLLRRSGATFEKLSLFRRGKGHYECRLREQDRSMADMEIHEHVVVAGPTAHLTAKLVHHNFDSLSSYILKHNEYSNWEARVWLCEDLSQSELPPTLLGTQAQRRRWLRRRFLRTPGVSLLYFLYKYVLCRGFLDGIPGLIYCGFQGVQFFHIKAKIYEQKSCRK